jgi:AmmeMemoRadiSam system protein B
MKENKLRIPAVAGRFYSAEKESLIRQIQGFIDRDVKKRDVIGCMLPHAGYMYSGKVAGKTISRAIIKDTIILLGPNHTGMGRSFSIMSEGKWQTPLGEVKIDSLLAKEILKNSQYLEEDVLAHTYEHSLEVELPFLQYLKPDFKIAPIVIMSADLAGLKDLGREIAQALKNASLSDKVMFVASSDMTHYEPQGEAQKKDSVAIEAILELNEDKLMERIQKFNISMCGYAPVIAMLSAAKAMGATHAELVKYETSGDVTGDKSAVVGYAGVLVY